MLYSDKYRHSKRDHVIEFFLFVIYKAFFEVLAIAYCSLPIYEREVNIDTTRIITGWVVYIIYVLCMQRSLKDEFFKSSFKFLFIIAGMTTMVVYEIIDIPLLSFIKAMIYWVLLLMAFSFNQKRNYRFKFPIKARKNVIDITFIFCAVLTLILSGIYAGFRITLSFDDVYEYRMAMRVAYMPTIIRYLFFFVGGTVLPLCFAYYCSKQDWLKVSVGGLLAIMMFSINGMKTWLIIYGMIFLIFLSFKINRRLIISHILVGFISLTLLAALTLSRGEYLVTGLLDRIIFLPSKIGYNYISFFDEHEFLFLRESILRFLGSPYPVNSGFYIVAGDMATETTSRANNGLWGDAYANFAFLGLVIYPILMGIIMRYLKSSLSGLDKRFAISLSFILLWSAVNSSFFTWLLSDGVIITIILARMIDRCQLRESE